MSLDWKTVDFGKALVDPEVSVVSAYYAEADVGALVNRVYFGPMHRVHSSPGATPTWREPKQSEK
jgi:hypothetical protein